MKPTTKEVLTTTKCHFQETKGGRRLEERTQAVDIFEKVSTLSEESQTIYVPSTKHLQRTCL
jgi:hypothetical protein